MSLVEVDHPSVATDIERLIHDANSDPLGDRTRHPGRDVVGYESAFELFLSVTPQVVGFTVEARTFRPLRRPNRPGTFYCIQSMISSAQRLQSLQRTSPY